MKTNFKWNAIIFSIIITTIIGWLVWSVTLYTYSIYYRIIDLQSQVYLALEWEVIKNKQIIDYLTDPINFSKSTDLFIDKIKENKITRCKEYIEDKIIPWVINSYFLIDTDIESKRYINKIKKMNIYYKKQGEYSFSWDLKINFVRYNKINTSSFLWWVLLLPIHNCEINTNTKFDFDCKFELTDFSDFMRGNIYNYLFFLSSNTWISYALEARDIDNNVIKIPSRYLEQDLSLYSKLWKINRQITSKVDLYDKFNLNINKSLYKIY